MSYVEFQTTIRSGLPVIAECYIFKGQTRSFYQMGEPESAELCKLLWTNRISEVPDHLYTEADRLRIEQEALEEAQCQAEAHI